MQSLLLTRFGYERLSQGQGDFKLHALPVLSTVADIGCIAAFEFGRIVVDLETGLYKCFADSLTRRLVDPHPSRSSQYRRGLCGHEQQ
jgi:hypothetical protein